MKKSRIAVIIIIILSFLVAVSFYPKAPDKIASHWNAQGEADSYMSKFWGLFFMPFVILGLFLLFIAIPKIDPLRANYEKFRKYYDGLVLTVILFMFYIYMLSVVWNTGRQFNMTLCMVPAIGLLFYYLGIIVENAKRNWFVGIRTPWTLSSDIVWEKTHKIGGKLFKAKEA